MQRTRFDPVAETYDNWCETPLGAMVMADETAALRALLPPDLAGVQVLDVGCGTGTWALTLGALGAHVTGVDLSGEMIRVARRKASLAGQTVQFLQGDASQLPFAPAGYDLVTALLALEFSDAPHLVLSEMARVLRPGGWALVATLNPYSIWTLLRRAGGLFRPTLYNSARFISRRRLSALLRTHGLVPEEWRAAVFYPPVAAPWSHAALRAIEAAGQRGLGFAPAFLAVRAARP